MLNLRHAAVRYRLGLLDTESIVRLSEAVLEDGLFDNDRRDSAAAIQISIMETPVMADVAPLFERLCTELGIPLPTNNEAIAELLRFHVESIASGTRAPRGVEKVLCQKFDHGRKPQNEI